MPEVKQQNILKLSQNQKPILEEIINKLKIDRNYLKTYPKLTFGSIELMKQQAEKLTNVENQLIHIKSKVNTELERIEARKNVVESVSDAVARTGKFALGVGKAAIGIKIMTVNFAVPFISDIISNTGENLLGDGCDNIGNALSPENTKKREQPVLLFLIQEIDILLSQNNSLKALAKECLENPELRERLEKKQLRKEFFTKNLKVILLLSFLAPVGFNAILSFFHKSQPKPIASTEYIDSNKNEIAEVEDKKVLPQNSDNQEQVLSNFGNTNGTSENNKNEGFSNNLEAAQKKAIEASVLVQNSPHPVEVWQQAESKWQEAIDLLEGIPLDAPVYTQAKEKLTAYKKNHSIISQRILIEQRSADNLKTAQELAYEAAVIVQNPPHSLEVWIKAQSKLEQSINLLKLIPQGVFVESVAKQKRFTYQNNYTAISSQIVTGAKKSYGPGSGTKN